MMQKIVLIFLFGALSLHLYAQDIPIVHVDDDSFVKVLKTSGLLVRLKTSENMINGLKRQGKLKEAEEAENKQRKEDLLIIQSFKKYYTFGPVFFFFSSISQNVIAHNIQNIFLDDSLMIDTGIKGPTGAYFIAEIGNIPSHSTGSSSYGLHLMNNQFTEINITWGHRLQSVRKLDLLGMRIRKIPEMVEDFNKRLKNY